MKYISVCVAATVIIACLCILETSAVPLSEVSFTVYTRQCLETGLKLRWLLLQSSCCHHCQVSMTAKTAIILFQHTIHSFPDTVNQSRRCRICCNCCPGMRGCGMCCRW
ncbi:hepcidin-like [Chanos chanos]|uniref:Hepcidin-like n=1 Tax=Chanos chanos TaxID=29144 RepID=A0A6J2W4A3_CHACN|nr:hepcidin-like [Chanos chanos]